MNALITFLKCWIRHSHKNYCNKDGNIVIFSDYNIITFDVQPGFIFFFFQAGFKKGRGTRHQIGNIHWIIEKAREFQKNIYFCFIEYAKAFDCVDHHKLWKVLQEMGIPDSLTCLLRILYAGQEVTVRTGHGKDYFQIGKGVPQVCILSSCLFNLYVYQDSWEKYR